VQFKFKHLQYEYREEIIILIHLQCVFVQLTLRM